MTTPRRTDTTHIAYVKNGDAVAELAATADLSALPDGGPHAYVAHFRAFARDMEALVVSVDAPGPDSTLTREGLTAMTLSARPALPVRALVLAGAVRRHRPQVVICGLMGPLLWTTAVACRLCRARLVLSCHNRPLATAGALGALRNALDAACMRRAAAVIHHGPYTRDELLSLGVARDRLHEFNWGFTDLPSLAAGHDGSAGDRRQRTVLFVGRLTAQKGVFLLLDALAPRLRDDSALELRFAGQGDAHDALAKRIADLGLTRSVHLEGDLSRDQLSGLLARSHVLAAPTLSSFPEGRCMAVMEALVLGIPVVAPDFGPFPHLVAHEANGLLHAPDSAPSLGQALGRILDDDALHARLGRGAAMTGKDIQRRGNGFRGALEPAVAQALAGRP